MKKKTIIFEPVCLDAELVSTWPSPAIKHLPDWYKNIKPYISLNNKLEYSGKPGTMPNVTLKKCMPFLDAMSNGYMIVLDDDVFVSKNDREEPIITWRTSDTIVTSHSTEQFQGINIPKECYDMVWKWQNQWETNVPDGYSILFTHPINRFDLPFFCFSGLVDCDKYNRSVEFPFLLKKDFIGIVPAGTPIAQLHIIKREHWQHKRNKFNQNARYIKNRIFEKTFVSSYKKNYWNIKKYE